MRLPLVGQPERSLGYGVIDWIERHCAIPDGQRAGEPFRLTGAQLRFVEWFYAVDNRGRFVFRRGQLVRPQKWGKGPLSAAIICAEAQGPALFSHFDADGVAIGRPWPTPWIQVTAVSEDQTDNVWTALVPMIELGALAADIPDTGRTRINVRGHSGSQGVIEPVTSAAISRLGQRITFACHDETHSWLKDNGGVKLADTQRRNLAGMGGRSLETTNAWDPGEESVAQTTFEANLDDVLIDYPEPLQGSIRSRSERRRVLKRAYQGAPWVSLDRIEAEVLELLPRDPGQAERFFANRIVAGQDKAFNVERWRELADPAETIQHGALISLGFDGARRQDSTALVATDIAKGFQHVVGVWEKPRDLRAEDWEVPGPEVDEAVHFAFENFEVWRMYGDPPYWDDDMDRWAGRYGEERVVKYWTNIRKKMAYSIKQWMTAWDTEDPLSHDGNEVLERHVANAIRSETKIRDEDDGSWLWVIRKDSPKSPRKIDAAMAAILSWEARGDAIRAGVLDAPVYSRGQW